MNPIRFNASVEGVNARIQITPTQPLTDSDGDGLPDYREEQTWVTLSGPLNFFSTDPYDNDTDDDGLADGQEVTITLQEVVSDCEEYTDRLSGVVCDDDEQRFRADISTDKKAARLDSISEMEEPRLFAGLRSITSGSKAFRLARHLPGDGTSLERVLRTLDFRSKRILADGSGDLDARFDRAIARAAEGDTADSDQLNDAIRTVGDLRGVEKTRAKRLIAETDGAGVKFVGKLDDAQLRPLLINVDSTPTLSRLSRQFDDGVVEERHLSDISELLDNGDMDGADSQFTSIRHDDTWLWTYWTQGCWRYSRERSCRSSLSLPPGTPSGGSRTSTPAR
jgi:hypothetical protein